MNRVDPRDRGLLGTAWYAGYLAHAARAGVDAVTLAATTGPSGIVYSKQDHAQPWFDEAGAAVFAKYHVLAGHCGLSGDVHETSVSDGRSVQALAVSGDGGTTVWLSNLTGEPQTVSLSGVPEAGMVRLLDASAFEAACGDADWRGGPATQVSASAIELDAYAVAEIRFG
ncbi:MAG TPA: hypothetical protein VK862_07005 [Afifellaceae bacterium]|nr:hypothetical protein [Afifellaceae bacterium]